MMKLKVDRDWISQYGKPEPEQMVDVGRFTVTGSRIVVGDPCRGRNAKESMILEVVKPGLWHAQIVEAVVPPFGLCNCGLMCTHEEARDWPAETPLMDTEFTIDVDSAQAGVFDAEIYEEDFVAERFVRSDTAYGLVPVTLAPGAIPYGVVCESGLGDWRYFGAASAGCDGQIVIVCLVFISVEFVDTDTLLPKGESKPAHGTEEWASSNENIQKGCEHDCAYCYAKESACQWGRATPASWSEPVLNSR